MRSRPPGESGNAVVELVLMVPVLLVVLFAVVAMGRFAAARADVEGAARDAARAASVARDPAGAAQDAEAAARESLKDQSITCRQYEVSTDTADFRPGGRVAVTVACTVELSDVSGAGLPGSRRFVATFTSPIDRFRGAG